MAYRLRMKRGDWHLPREATWEEIGRALFVRLKFGESERVEFSDSPDPLLDVIAGYRAAERAEFQKRLARAGRI